MMVHNPFRRLLGFVSAGVLALLILLPGAVAAHSELVSSTPAEGATVPATFTGPIILTFSEALASGSKADLIGPDGSTIGAATVDGPGKTMTFTLTAPLPAGAYQVKWTSIANDGDVLRLPIVHFTVAAGSSASPAPGSDPSGGSSSSDVLIPIVVALIILGSGAAYLLNRRNRPSTPA